nr:immunoglobulin heavy chain junction region [Macaca mulatta]
CARDVGLFPENYW